jgi:hypothetical protein
VHGVAESLEAITALVVDAKKKLDGSLVWYNRGPNLCHVGLIHILDHIVERVGFYQEVQAALRGGIEYNCEFIHAISFAGHPSMGKRQSKLTFMGIVTEQHSLVRLYDDMKLTLKYSGKMKSEEGKGLLLGELKKKNYSKELDVILGSGAAISRLAIPTAVNVGNTFSVW